MVSVGTWASRDSRMGGLQVMSNSNRDGDEGFMGGGGGRRLGGEGESRDMTAVDLQGASQKMQQRRTR